MGTKTGISWTDATWNPIRGCSRVSKGCQHCYAESVAYRFSGPGLAYEGLVKIGALGERRREWNGKIKFVEEHLLDPLKWKPVLNGIARGEGVLREKANRNGTVTVTRERSRRIFVNSMSDLFHENVTDEMRDKIFAVMALCPQHTFQVLTKRPERMLAYCSTLCMHDVVARISLAMKRIDPLSAGRYGTGVNGWHLPNVQLGVSVEDQKTADLRIPLLMQTPAAVRFTSAEPLLGGIDFEAVPAVNNRTLDWVIVGGESGPGARPMHPDWARSLRDQCKAAGVPFFFKQWGEWGDWDGSEENDHQAAAVASIVNDERKWPTHLHNFGEDPENGDWAYRIGIKAAGCLLDGVEHHEFPAVPA